MGIPKPLSQGEASGELRDIYAGMEKAIGHMPNILAVMARFPAALRRFVPFYNTVMSEGKVDPKYKELAYLKTSLVNTCQY
jgi:alkylhydroperoxidase/carboxymuconolactone decarboxylase family protein YurZ